MNEQDWLDPHTDEIEAEFEVIWLDICDMAERMGVGPSYIEEECYILGELFSLDPSVSEELGKEVLRRYRHNDDKGGSDGFRFNPRPTTM